MVVEMNFNSSEFHLNVNKILRNIWIRRVQSIGNSSDWHFEMAYCERILVAAFASQEIL